MPSFSSMAIRVKARSGESTEQLQRRFKKLCEKEGLTKDIKRKEFYEKPSERRVREKAEAIRPAGNDDARLRWNACARLIMHDRHLVPIGEERGEPLLLE